MTNGTVTVMLMLVAIVGVSGKVTVMMLVSTMVVRILVVEFV